MTEAISISSHAIKQWRERSDKRSHRKGVTDEELRKELFELFSKSRRVKLSNSNYAYETRKKHGSNAAYYVTTRKGFKWLMVFGYGSYLVTIYRIRNADDRWVDYITNNSIN